MAAARGVPGRVVNSRHAVVGRGSWVGRLHTQPQDRDVGAIEIDMDDNDAGEAAITLDHPIIRGILANTRVMAAITEPRINQSTSGDCAGAELRGTCCLTRHVVAVLHCLALSCSLDGGDGQPGPSR